MSVPGGWTAVRHPVGRRRGVRDAGGDATGGPGLRTEGRKRLALRPHRSRRSTHEREGISTGELSQWAPAGLLIERGRWKTELNGGMHDSFYTTATRVLADRAAGSHRHHRDPGRPPPG